MYSKKRQRDKEIEEIIDGEIMEWDLQDFGWESTTDHFNLDPKQDHINDDHHHNIDFTNSATPQKKKIINTSLPDDDDDDDGGDIDDDDDQGLAAASGCSGGAAQKRGIGGSSSSGAHKASCLVDGCEADLSGCRDYHKRHRVCERHSKTPTVVVNGEEKRFCQQCSRFHSLGEFDEVKRSCRKRLDGHNRRRRKSHPQPLYFTSKNFLSGYRGPRILQFGNPLWHLETKTGSESWLYSNNPQTSFSTMTSSSDEEISLPIDSGGRALYLLSTSQAPVNHDNRSFQLVDYDPINPHKTINNGHSAGVYGP